MKRTALARTLAVGAACSAAVFGVTSAQGHSTSEPSLHLTDVKVIDAKTVEATFSDPLSASNVDLALRVFHAPHFDHLTPHSHEAAAVALVNQNRTARVTLARALHPEESVCDIETEPRCSDDRLDFVVKDARDIYGRTVSDDEWRVWAVGSKD